MVQKSSIGIGFGLGTGFTFLFVGALSFTFFDDIIRSQIVKKVVLVPGTEAYSLWQEPPIPIYMQIWVWDLQNEKEVSAGGKPNITQRGPYTYSEHRKKVNIKHNNNGTISYRQIKTYHFEPSMSVGPDNETFTTINIPYLTLVDGMRNLPWWLQSFIAILLNFTFKSEGPFMNRTVQETVWGYNDTILQYANKIHPSTFNQYNVGVLAGKNATDDGEYTIFTGETNTDWIGVIDKYNGARMVNYWTSDEANMVNGTDGTVGPPFINESMIVRMFSTDICRSVYGTYHGKVKTLDDITLYRFTAPKEAMEAPDKNPSNAGFCTPAGNCLGDGVLNVSTCQIVDSFHLPIVVSSPHFYEADPKYVNAVYNMHPNPDEHSTNIDIEPNTGFVMQVNKRLQINAYVKPDGNFPKTKNLPTVVFPIVWLNESALTDQAHAQQLTHELFIPKQVLGILKFVLVLAGTVTLLAICTFVVIKQIPKPQKLSISAEDPKCKDEFTPTAGILSAPSMDPILPD